MSHRRAGVALAGFTLAVCVLAGGCQSPSSLGSLLARRGSGGGDLKTASAPLALAPGMEVEWHVKTVRDTPNQISSGLSVVGPDGAIELGPYGSCRVAGMPMAQASATLEKHLAKYLHSPTVKITPLAPPPASDGIAWHPSRTPASSGKQNGDIFRTAFQTPSAGGDKDIELIPPPKTVAPPGATAAAPIVEGPLFSAPAPNECRPALMPPYVIGPTDVLLIESLIGLQTQPVRGPHLVGPDGTVRIGAYGAPVLAGLTLDQARVAVAQVVFPRLRQAEKSDENKKDDQKELKFTLFTFEDVLKGVSVDVLAYNSKQFFIIADGGGQGDQVVTLPITGNDNVLNAMSKINGLPLIASKHHIWVARLSCPGCPEMRLPVDWIGITQRGEGMTNWQIMPNDRIYVKADLIYATDRYLAKWLAPVERVFGGMLLGSQTVNSIKSGTVGGTR
jgi:polysaccharide biosynthesis/export protein